MNPYKLSQHNNGEQKGGKPLDKGQSRTDYDLFKGKMKARYKGKNIEDEISSFSFDNIASKTQQTEEIIRTPEKGMYSVTFLDLVGRFVTLISNMQL